MLTWELDGEVEVSFGLAGIGGDGLGGFFFGHGEVRLGEARWRTGWEVWGLDGLLK